jgi:hypothetical protein
MKVGQSEFHLQGHLGPLRPLSHRAQHWAHRVRHALGGPPAPPRTAGGTNPNPWRMLEVQTPASMATKLCELVRQGDPDRLRRALNSPVADPNRLDGHFDCAQTVAIRNDNLEMLTIVLDDPRVNPDRADGHLTKTALIDALEHGSDQMVNALLDRSDVSHDASDWFGTLPFEVAAKHGRLAALRRLLPPAVASTPQGQAMVRRAAERAAQRGQPQTLLYAWDQANDNTRRSIVDRMVSKENWQMLRAVSDHDQSVVNRGFLSTHFRSAIDERRWADVAALVPLVPKEAVSPMVLKGLFLTITRDATADARVAALAAHGCRYLDRLDSSTPQGSEAEQRKLLRELHNMDSESLALTLACLVPAAAQAHDLALGADSPFVQELLQGVPRAPAIARTALALVDRLDMCASWDYFILDDNWRERERFPCAAPLINALMRIAEDSRVRPEPEKPHAR